MPATEGEGINVFNDFYGDSIQSNPTFQYYPDWNFFGFAPIIAPPDTDHVGCRAPRLRFMRASSGRPYFEWTSYTDEETLQYEVQYAQLGSNEWRTTYPTSSPFRIIDNFDATKYYTARIRMQHRHGCPIHDTVYWSPWSDTVLFYTGSTAPDTSDTIGIAPVEANAAAFFTLTPNPTTGKVTVTVGHTPQSGTHSSALAGTSPNLGEEFSLTLRDAAGHEVLRKSLPAGTDSVDLDLSRLPAGAYFVTLSTPTSSATQRLVVR